MIRVRHAKETKLMFRLLNFVQCHLDMSKNIVHLLEHWF